jgi:hypothetical protein
MQALLPQRDPNGSESHRRRLLAQSDHLLDRVEHLHLMESEMVPPALARSIRGLQLQLGWTGAAEAHTLRAAQNQVFSVQQRLMAANPRVLLPRAHLGRPRGAAKVVRLQGAGGWKFLSLPAPAAHLAEQEWGEFVRLTVQRALDRWCWAQGKAVVLARRDATGAPAAVSRARAAWANYWELQREAERLLGGPAHP